MTVASPGQVARPAAGVHAGLPPPAHAQQRPLFQFGLLSDVQYADIPDGFSFHGVPRFYRQALVALERAVSHFKREKVDFCVHLGDIIDYHNSVAPPKPDSTLSPSQRALRSVLEQFGRLDCPTLHMLGNHCLYNASREELNERLGINGFKEDPTQPHSHYSFSPHPGWRFVVLDGYDVSLLGWPAGHPLHEAAAAILAEKNPNTEKNSTVGLEGAARRFVKFGGGISAEQLAWLEGQLQAARAGGQRVVVCGHLCLHPRTCHGACLCWNYEAVLQVLQAHSDVVVATLSGHAHCDGYYEDECGIHHRVCKCVLETPAGRDCYGIVDVFPDRLVIHGVDTFGSGEWVVGGGKVVGGPHDGSAAAAAGAAEGWHEVGEVSDRR